MSSQPCCLISSMLQECGVVQQNLIYGNKIAKKTFHSIAKVRVLENEDIGEGSEHSRNIAVTKCIQISQKYTAVIIPPVKELSHIGLEFFGELTLHPGKVNQEHRTVTHQHSMLTLFTHNT